MLFATPPAVATGADLPALQSYLWRTAEQLNIAFSQVSAEATMQVVADAVSANEKLETDTAALARYQALKALVVKTADWTLFESEEFSKKLSSRYVASGDFGRYFENASVTIDGNSFGIRQMYSYTAGIRSEYADMDLSRQTWIKTGFLYYDDDGLPVYGVGVGEIATKLTVDGEPVLDRGGLVATYTADRVSFWQSDAEVAYISAGALHLPSAAITGGTLNIGDGRFSVDALGKLTATGADISGRITATEGVIGGCSIVNGVLQVSAASIGGIDAGKITSGVLSSSRLSSDVLTTSNFYAVRIDAGQIVSGRISSAFLDASVITTATLTASRIISNASEMLSAYATLLYMCSTSGAIRAQLAYTGVTGYSGSASTTASWYAIANAASDRDIKNSIEELPEAYEAVFDGLRPVRFKYNDGGSGRYHTGFIAQDIAAAVEAAGMTTKELAAVIRLSDEDAAARPDKSRWEVRKDELVALNTWQIQKLKKEVQALKEAING